MKKETARTLRAFAIELAIYALLVVAYFFLMLNLLGELRAQNPCQWPRGSGIHSGNFSDHGGVEVSHSG